MYKKYELLPHSLTQGVAEEGIVKVRVQYKSVDPEKNHDFPNSYQYVDYDFDIAEGDEISWDSVNALVAAENGIVQSY